MKRRGVTFLLALAALLGIAAPALADGAQDVASAYGRKLRPLLASLSIKGSLGETTRIPTAGAINAPVLVLVGLGRTPSTADLRRARALGEKS